MKTAQLDPPVTFYDLRNTYGARLARAGVPMAVIAAQLGHADTRITERHYAHVAPSYVADTIRSHFQAIGNLGVECRHTPTRLIIDGIHQKCSASQCS